MLDLFVGVSFSVALPNEHPNEVIKKTLAEIEASLCAAARVQMHEAYEDREGMKKGDYYLTYYIDGLRADYTKALIGAVADRMSLLTKENVYGRIHNPFENGSCF